MTTTRDQLTRTAAHWRKVAARWRGIRVPPPPESEDHARRRVLGALDMCWTLATARAQQARDTPPRDTRHGALELSATYWWRAMETLCRQVSAWDGPWIELAAGLPETLIALGVRSTPELVALQIEADAGPGAAILALAGFVLAQRGEARLWPDVKAGLDGAPYTTELPALVALALEEVPPSEWCRKLAPAVHNRLRRDGRARRANPAAGAIPLDTLPGTGMDPPGGPDPAQVTLSRAVAQERRALARRTARGR
jgi:hypothetical protein